jgi:hypothetical protein
VRGSFARSPIAWAILVITSVVAVSEERRNSGTVFEFDSGAATHPEGFGAWKVKVQGNRADFEHRVHQRTTRYPPVTLTESEQNGLWNLIGALDFSQRSQTVRPSIPDQAALILSLSDRTGTRRLYVLVDWNKADDPVTRLVQRLAELIAKYTGEKPVLA